MAGALVQWLREEAPNQKVVSSNPSNGYWMYIFSHLFVVRIVMFVWKDEINEKEARVGLFFQKANNDTNKRNNSSNYQVGPTNHT